MYALALTLCTYAACNTYVIEVNDDWKTPQACEVQVEKEFQKLDNIWQLDYEGRTLFRNYGSLEEYFADHFVQEDPSTLESYGINCIQMDEPVEGVEA